MKVGSCAHAPEPIRVVQHHANKVRATFVSEKTLVIGKVSIEPRTELRLEEVHQ